MPSRPSPCPWCNGSGLDLACFAVGQAVHYAGSAEVFVIEARRYTQTDSTTDRMTYLIARREGKRWADEALLIAHTPHRPAGEPCTCLPGTAGWTNHHGTPPGTLSEAFHEAMENFHIEETTVE